MNQFKREAFISLKDFDYIAPMGVDSIKLRYEKGEVLNLRVEGKMAKELVKEECIEIIES